MPDSPRKRGGQHFSRQEILQAAVSYGYVALWITLSATVILYNK
jgi:hypothetical protein